MSHALHLNLFTLSEANSIIFVNYVLLVFLDFPLFNFLWFISPIYLFNCGSSVISNCHLSSKGFHLLGSSIILFNTLLSLKLSHFIGTIQFNLRLVSDFLTYLFMTSGTFLIIFFSLFVWESYLIRSS